MKKMILGFMGLTYSMLVNADITPVQRLLLIDDAETCAKGSKSFINWSNYANKDISVNPETLSPVQIYFEYRQNVFNAEGKYSKNMQVVHAPFQSIERNDYGDPIMVFDVNYVNHIYMHGLSAKELQSLNISKPVDLLCTNFKLDKFNDMSATCSMILKKSKFIASIIAQNITESAIKNNTPKDIYQKFKSVDRYLKKDAIQFINENCQIVDSTNYDLCLGELRYGKNP